MLLFAGYKHATIVWFERNFFSKTDSENLLIYSLTNKALLAKQKKDKRILNTQMFVKAWTGTWFGFVEKMFMFSPGRRNPENLFFFLAKTTVILRYIHLRTSSLTCTARSLRLLEGTWQQLFL